MKMRNCFVSNSSSCSFIVKLVGDQDTEIKEEICSQCGNIYKKAYDSILDEIDTLCKTAEDEKSVCLTDYDDPFDTDIKAEFGYRDDAYKIYLIDVDKCNDERLNLINNYINKGVLEKILVECP